MLKKLIIALIILTFNILMLMFPQEVISAAKDGLLLWYNNVLPSLLPFMIGANLLAGTGLIRRIGKLLHPIMMKIFGVPGAGSFALIAGLMSGYPVGAKIATDLRQNGTLTKIEARRLIAFCNNAGPSLIIGSVATTMLGAPQLGYFMLVIHIIAALSTGVLFKFILKDKPGTNVILQASNASTNKSFVSLFGDSVTSAVTILTQVGGFIVLFSVIARLIDSTGLMSALNDVSRGFLIGTIEIVNGANILNETALDTSHKALLIGALAAWGGLSIHAQTINIINKTDIGVSVYICGKALHMIFAIIYGLLALKISEYITAPNWPVFSNSFATNSNFGFTIVVVVPIAIFVCLKFK